MEHNQISLRGDFTVKIVGIRSATHRRIHIDFGQNTIGLCTAAILLVPGVADNLRELTLIFKSPRNLIVDLGSRYATATILARISL